MVVSFPDVHGAAASTFGVEQLRQRQTRQLSIANRQLNICNRRGAFNNACLCFLTALPKF